MQTSEETKILIAENFKLLLQKHKFSEITVCMLCEKCNLNRKFFYKYFRDKYDLANFIFKKDFLDEYANQNPTFSEIFEPMIFYYNENQKLYKKLLEKVEQNSFTETLHKLIFEYISLLQFHSHIFYRILIFPCFVLPLVFHQNHSEIFWQYSSL